MAATAKQKKAWTWIHIIITFAVVGIVTWLVIEESKRMKAAKEIENSGNGETETA